MATAGGARIVRNEFAGVAARIVAAVGEVLDEAGDAVVEGAQARVPQRTRRLYKTIRKERESTLLIRVAAGAMQVDEVFVDYADDVEFGGRYRAASPFLRPAAEAERARFASRFRNLQGRLKGT